MKTSILLPRFTADGLPTAPRPESPDHAALLTGGDVPAEYRASRERCLVFDETDRGLVRATGSEATDFLHRILSNRIHDLKVGEGSRNLLLSPKGKVRYDVDVAVDEAEVRLSTPPGLASDFAAAVDGYLFSEDVQLTDATDTHAPLDLTGPEARSVLETVLGSVPELEGRGWHELEWNGHALELSARSVAGQPGYRLDAGPDGAADLWTALLQAGATAGGLVVRDILRVEHGTALFGVDIDENVYPQEARLEEAYCLEKGCYTGQEVVAKIDTYGGLNKRLMALRVDHDDPVPRGTRLLGRGEDEGRDLGVVTSWAYSFPLDTGVVLAFCKRKHQEPGMVFTLDGVTGTATILEAAE